MWCKERASFSLLIFVSPASNFKSSVSESQSVIDRFWFWSTKGPAGRCSRWFSPDNQGREPIARAIMYFFRFIRDSFGVPYSTSASSSAEIDADRLWKYRSERSACRNPDVDVRPCPRWRSPIGWHRRSGRHRTVVLVNGNFIGPRMYSREFYFSRVSSANLVLWER